MSQLKMAQQKFGDSRENVKKLMNKDQGWKFPTVLFSFIFLALICAKKTLFVLVAGKEILVPLTSAVSS